jgi:hypothetical protein
VRLGKRFWVGEEMIWLKMEADAAWEGVLGGCVGGLAQGEGGVRTECLTWNSRRPGGIRE